LRPKRLKAWRHVPEYIADLFSAAIDEGVHFTVNGTLVQARSLPILEEQKTMTGSYLGRGYEIVCGILTDPKQAKSGWEVRYGWQTLDRGYIEAGFDASRGYSPNGFYGRILLVDQTQKWTLARNKTKVEELDECLNSEELQNFIRPILEKLKERGQTVQIRLNQEKVRHLLQQMYMAAASLTEETEEGGKVGGNGNGNGTGQAGKGGTRKKREEDPKGKKQGRFGVRQLIQVLPHNQPNFFGVGHVAVTDHGKMIRIFLDNTIEYTKQVWVSRDEGKALLYHALMLLSSYYGGEPEGQRLFGELFKGEDYAEEHPAIRISKVWLKLTELCVSEDILAKNDTSVAFETQETP
jgi:hypothetical protein